MADQTKQRPNGCGYGCVGAIVGMVVVYVFSASMYQSGTWGRFPNGGQVGEDIVALAPLFNALLYGILPGALVGLLVAALRTASNRRKSE